MQTAALITFLVVGLFVWGGLLVIIRMALRRESLKTSPLPGDGRPPPDPSSR